MPPIFVFVRIQFAEIVAQNIRQPAAPSVTPVVAVQTIAHRLIRRALHRDIQRRVNAQPALMHRFGSVGRFQILANFFEKIRRQIVARILHMQTERRLLRRFLFGARRSFPSSSIRYSTRLRRAKCARRIRQRRKFRPIHHAGEQRRFLQLQIANRLAEIKFRRCRESIIAVRQINLVRIHRKNLRLRVAALDLQRQQHFLHLAAKAFVAAVEKQIAGKLHADRARARRDAVMQDVAPRRARDARKIDAPVLFKMLVFDRRHRVVQNLGHCS